MWPATRKEKVDKRQERIRDSEWRCTEKFLAERSPGSFLDVGCGTGYQLLKAEELGFLVVGVDPEIGGHGVPTAKSSHHIVNAAAEALPFQREGSRSQRNAQGLGS